MGDANVNDILWYEVVTKKENFKRSTMYLEIDEYDFNVAILESTFIFSTLFVTKFKQTFTFSLSYYNCLNIF